MFRRTVLRMMSSGGGGFIKDEHSGMKYWEQSYKVPEEEKPKDYFDLYKASYDESGLSHVDSDGKAKMVDVGDKTITKRTAVARASIAIGQEAFRLVETNAVKKGDVLTVSQLAGIMGAKRTSDLIPLCHPIALTSVDVDLRLNAKEWSIDIECVAKCRGRTGVEMEALTGASVAALTVYDMCKAVNKEMVVKEVRLVEKKGGKSDYKSE